MVTNSYGFPGYTIIKSHGIVSVRKRSVHENYEDHAPKYSWKATFANAVKMLEAEAAELGANAVICVSEEVYKLGQSDFGEVILILTGTAVTVVEDQNVHVELSHAEHEAVPRETVRPKNDSTDESFIICQKCGTRQRKNRSVCFNCGVQFQ